MLEAIIGLGPRALGDDEVGLGKLVERVLKGPVADARDGAQQRVGEIAAEHSADLRDFARFAKPVEPRGERLLQRRRDGLQAAGLAPLEQETRHLLDVKRHSAGALAQAFHHLLAQRMAGGDLANHLRDVGRSRGLSEMTLW